MDMIPRSIAFAGIGKIACDAHVPALNDSAEWELAATIRRNAKIDCVDGYEDIDSFLDARPDIGTVSLALPPGPRYDYAAKAVQAGRNVMLEKPPGRTLSECETVADLAREAGVTLYASWHSRMGRAVSEVAARLRGATLTVDGDPVDVGAFVGYPAVYARLTELVCTGESEVDLRPMRHVADAFLIGRHQRSAPFHWERD